MGKLIDRLRYIKIKYYILFVIESSFPLTNMILFDIEENLLISYQNSLNRLFKRRYRLVYYNILTPLLRRMRTTNE